MDSKELLAQERDARGVRAQHASYLLVRTMIAFDLAIRRAAYRLRSLAGGDGSRWSGPR